MRTGNVTGRSICTLQPVLLANAGINEFCPSCLRGSRQPSTAHSTPHPEISGMLVSHNVFSLTLRTRHYRQKDLCTCNDSKGPWLPIKHITRLSQNSRQHDTTSHLVLKHIHSSEADRRLRLQQRQLGFFLHVTRPVSVRIVWIKSQDRGCSENYAAFAIDLYCLQVFYVVISVLIIVEILQLSRI